MCAWEICRKFCRYVKNCFVNTLLERDPYKPTRSKYYKSSRVYSSTEGSRYPADSYFLTCQKQRPISAKRLRQFVPKLNCIHTHKWQQTSAMHMWHHNGLWKEPAVIISGAQDLGAYSQVARSWPHHKYHLDCQHPLAWPPTPCIWRCNQTLAFLLQERKPETEMEHNLEKRTENPVEIQDANDSPGRIRSPLIVPQPVSTICVSLLFRA